MQTSGLTKNASAPQISADIITALRDIPMALLSDNMQRNSGSVGLAPYHKPARSPERRSQCSLEGETTSQSCAPSNFAGRAMSW
jgi:hypothetical protein